MDERKSTYWKFAIVFLAIIVLAVGGVIAWNIYSQWRGSQAAERPVAQPAQHQP